MGGGMGRLKISPLESVMVLSIIVWKLHSRCFVNLNLSRRATLLDPSTALFHKTASSHLLSAGSGCKVAFPQMTVSPWWIEAKVLSGFWASWPRQSRRSVLGSALLFHVFAFCFNEFMRCNDGISIIVQKLFDQIRILQFKRVNWYVFGRENGLCYLILDLQKNISIKNKWFCGEINSFHELHQNMT